MQALHRDPTSYLSWLVGDLVREIELLVRPIQWKKELRGRLILREDGLCSRNLSITSSGELAIVLDQSIAVYSLVKLPFLILIQRISLSADLADKLFVRSFGVDQYLFEGWDDHVPYFYRLNGSTGEVMKLKITVPFFGFGYGNPVVNLADNCLYLFERWDPLTNTYPDPQVYPPLSYSYTKIFRMDLSSAQTTEYLTIPHFVTQLFLRGANLWMVYFEAGRQTLRLCSSEHPSPGSIPHRNMYYALFDSSTEQLYGINWHDRLIDSFGRQITLRGIDSNISGIMCKILSDGRCLVTYSNQLHLYE